MPFVIGVVASAGMMLVYASVPSSVGIALGMALSAVSMALVVMGRTTIVGRAHERTGLATTYAVLITLANIGLIVGTNFGTFVFPYLGYQELFAAGGVVCLIGVVVAFGWLPKSRIESEQRFWVVKLRNVSPRLRRFYAATCLDSFSWSMVMPFFSITPARIFQVNENDIALIQTLMFGASTTTNVVFGALSDRLWGRKLLLTASEALGVITLGLYLFAPGVQPIFVSALLMGLVISTWSPIVSAYVSEVSTVQELHDNVGTWMTLTALLRIPGPIIGGYLAERWFPRAPYLVSLFLVVGAAIFIQRYLAEPGSNQISATAA